MIGRSGSGKSLLAPALTKQLPRTVKLHGEVISPARTTLIHQDSADAFNPIVRMGKQLGIAEQETSKVIATLATLGFEHPEDILQRFPAASASD